MLYYASMKFHILTLFPNAFSGPLQHSMLGRAQEHGLISVEITDIRDHTHNAHNTADDYQFGGGFGMVMKPEPIFEAVEDTLSRVVKDEREATPIILMSPQGETLDQQMIINLSHAGELILICGHYAGVDQRVRQHLITHEVSIGDYVLTGGELPAMVLIDAVVRLIPGALGDDESAYHESFSHATSRMLDHPQYTRPAQWEGMEVPPVLLSGNHAEIESWRRVEARRRTAWHRPDLIEDDSGESGQ